ncbi:MAG: T9SS type A sorting domain-containing protein [bacterium]
MRNKILMGGVFLLIFATGIRAELPPWLSAVPKIVTPDGNNHNDIFYIFYNLPADPGRVSGKVFNLIGMKMADFRNVGGEAVAKYPEPDGTWEGYLYWDVGSAPSGIYIYQIESGNETYTGTVVVAR